MITFFLILTIFVLCVVYCIKRSCEIEQDIKQKYPKLFDDKNWEYSYKGGMLYLPTNELFKRYIKTYSVGFLIPYNLNRVLSSDEKEILEQYINDLFNQREREYKNHPDRLKEKREREERVKHKYG
jgi:hypothetical protein